MPNNDVDLQVAKKIGLILREKQSLSELSISGLELLFEYRRIALSEQVNLPEEISHRLWKRIKQEL